MNYGFSYTDLKDLADMVVRNSFNGNKLSKDSLFLIFLKGQSLGLHPMTALDFLHVVSGKVSLSPQGMLALINHSGRMLNMQIEPVKDGVSVTMTSKIMTHTETFTMDKARALGLMNNQGWKTQPENMLKWRAISACARVVFSDVIQGMYLTEELTPNATLDENGNVLELPAPTTHTTPSLPAQTPPPERAQTFSSAIVRITRTARGWTVASAAGVAFTNKVDKFTPLGIDANVLEVMGEGEFFDDVMGVLEAEWFANDKWSGYVVKRMFRPTMEDEMTALESVKRNADDVLGEFN
jgi:hypothetical protein